MHEGLILKYPAKSIFAIGKVHPKRSKKQQVGVDFLCWRICQSFGGSKMLI